MSAYSAAHKAHVQLLYKRYCQNALAHFVRRDHWRIVCMDIRAQFEANRHVQNPKQLATLLANAEADLEAHLHPMPMIPPNMPEGTKWEREGERIDLSEAAARRGDWREHWKQR